MKRLFDIEDLDRGMGRTSFRLGLKGRVAEELSAQYEARAQEVLASLYAGSGRPVPIFSLEARWLQKALERRAGQMTNNAARVLQRRIARIDRQGLSATARLSAIRTAGMEYEDKLFDSIDATARLLAMCDQLVHSGFVDPEKDAVMYFGGSPAPCDLCLSISDGNPYTIDEATNIGPEAHPNCRDDWEQGWQPGEELFEAMKLAIKEGVFEGWTGTGRTPAALRALYAERFTRQTPRNWGEVRKYAVELARQRGVPEVTVEKIVSSVRSTAQKKVSAA